jgi:hypothetical protein
MTVLWMSTGVVTAAVFEVAWKCDVGASSEKVKIFYLSFDGRNFIDHSKDRA